MQGAVVDDGVHGGAIRLLLIGDEMFDGRLRPLRLDGFDLLDGHDAAQVRILAEVFEITAGLRDAAEVHTGRFKDMVGDVLRFNARDLAPFVGSVSVPSGGDEERGGDGGGGRIRLAIASRDANGSVGEAKSGDAEARDSFNMPRIAPLSAAGERGIGSGIESDLFDLLVEGHGMNEETSPIGGRGGRVHPR